MTEIDRILQKGQISPDFLKTETKCDFLIDRNRKILWAVLLDMLLEFDRVCKKHQLTYFLAYGTLIGAIRHQGFIPWDDDLDVMMFRDDYEKFLTLKDEFKEPLFLQNHLTDPDFASAHTTIRNSNTSAFSEIIKYQKMNHGLFMDVFPLDNVLPNEDGRRYEEINQLNTDNGTYMRLTNPELSEENKQRVAKYIADGKNHHEDWQKIHRIATRYNDSETGFLSDIILTFFPFQKHIFHKEDFAGVKYVDFEGFSFPIPLGYDRVLRVSYGDYMQLPPVADRGQKHSYYTFEPEMPYRVYQESFLNQKKDR